MEDLQPHEEEVELPLVDETTEEESTEESVDTFEDSLESAETDEDYAALGEAARGEESQPDELEEEAKDVESEIDNEVEEEDAPSFNIGKGFSIKDGEIELNITDEAKLRQLAQMGLNYGNKTTELAKYRSFVKYAEDKGISLEDIQQLADIKGGNKDAYSALAKGSGIDVYDIKEEHTYNPGPVVTPQYSDPMVDTIAQEILSNEEHTAQFQKWVNNDRMPPEVVQSITTDPNALRAVQADINAGIFDKAMHQAYSDVKVNGMEFNTAYLRAKEMIVGTQAPVAVEPAITRGDRVRASANRSKSSAQSKTYGSISDMSNDDFLDNFQDIIGNLDRPQ